MSQPPPAARRVRQAASRLATNGRSRFERWFKDAYKEIYSGVQEVLREWDAENADPSRGALEAAESDQRGLRVESRDSTSSRNGRENLTQVSTNGRSLAMTEDERQLNRYVGASAVSIAAAVGSVFFPPLSLLALGAGLYGGVRIFRHGYNALVNERRLTMSVMLSLHFVGVFVGGFVLAGSFALLAYYLSEKFVAMTQRRAQQSLIKIFGEQPRTAWQLVDNIEVQVPVESLEAGDVVVVHAGQVIPVDGVIVDGIATIDQHVLTGESQPAEKGVGDPVLTGTLMMAGQVHVQVEATGEETVAAQVGVILNSTASYQANLVSRGEQMADQSVGPTMVLALIALPLAGYRYMVTILGAGIGLNVRLTTPIAMLNYLTVAIDHGVLVKDGRSLELLKTVDTVIFDKTGTLTLDQPEIGRIHTCAEWDAETVLQYAAAAEHRQTHPIARAILTEAFNRGLSLPEVDGTQYQMGYGLSVQLDDRLIRVGSDRYMDLEQIAIPASMHRVLEESYDRGHSLVMVAVNDQVVGAIELQTKLRPEVKAVVRELRQRDLDIIIISGDQEQPTSKLARELGIHGYYSNTLPEEKARLVEQLQREGRSVCFVGDGINDSISLKKANVSISLRGSSTAATDSAQIVLTGQGLDQLPFVFQLADEFDGNMRAGYVVSVGQGVIVIGGALVAVVGIVPATLIWVASLVVSLGIAQLPRLKHQSGGSGLPTAAEEPLVRRRLDAGQTVGDVLRQKFVDVALMWDADGDGFIEEVDYAIAAGRLAGLSGLDADSDEYAEMHRQLLNGWELVRSFDSDGDGRVSAEECIGGFASLFEDRERFERTIVVPSASAFDLIDSDHDGRITADDHVAYLVALGIDADVATTAFPELDADGDGFVTRDEFVVLMEEFFTSDDPDARGNSIFGKK